jgi:hypothetical protein
MSKSSLKVQGALAGLVLAAFLSGCDLIEPVAAQGPAPALAASEAAYPQPDHP